MPESDTPHADQPTASPRDESPLDAAANDTVWRGAESDQDEPTSDSDIDRGETANPNLSSDIPVDEQPHPGETSAPDA